MKTAIFAALALSAALASSPALAAQPVEYNFSYLNDNGTTYDAFTYVEPDFVTTATTISALDTTGCTFANVACTADESFKLITEEGATLVEMFKGSNGGGFLFPANALSTFGSFTAWYAPTATLTVSPAAASAAPEPAAWALMILGLGLTGAALRRRTIVAAA